MRTILTIIKMLLAVIIIATIAGLTWWFFFLRAQVSDITAVDAARGLNEVVPSFTNVIGSTYKNIVSSMTGENASSTSETSQYATARLRQIDSSPIAGMQFIGTSTAESLYFVQDTTGYVLSASLQKDSIMRITNTLMPKVRESVFASNGSVLIRSLDDVGNIRTFAATISTSTATSTNNDTTSTSGLRTLTGKDLAKNILQVAVHPKNAQILYLSSDPNGGSTINQANIDGSKAKPIFTSPLKDWRLSWLSDNRIIVTPKPADGVLNYVYQLQPSNGTLIPILRDIPGGTALLQASTSAMIFSVSSQGTIVLFSASSSKATPTKLSLKTITEKCVWGVGKSTLVYCAVPREIPSKSFLNDWYRGMIHTNDSWWQIDVNTGSTTQMMDTHDTPLDVQKPVIDPTGNYIAFINGSDQSLWLLRVRE